MQIDLDRFVALTALLAAPLLAMPACIITTTGGDDDTGGDTTGNQTTDNQTTGSPSTTTSADGSTTDAATGSTGADGTAGSDGTAGETTGGNTLGNCCEAHAETGCEVTEVSDCVCASDAFCCEMEWDANCVMEVNQLGCGECVLPPTAWDCSCIVTGCDAIPLDMLWQVCGADEVEAGTAGLDACEAAAADASCDVGVCSECACSTAEVAEIDCSM